MPMIRAMRLLNAVEAGTTTGAQLETLLTADPGRLAEFNVLLGMRGQMRRMTASSTAMTAVAASSTAMTAVAASSTAMTAVAASSTAMAAVNANDQAVRIWMLAGTNQVYSNFASVTAVAASSTAKMAIFNSDTALGAIAASSTALTTMRAATGYVVQSASVTSSTAIPGLNAGGSYILLGISSPNNPVNSNPISVSTKRSGSARANTGLLIASQSTTPTTTSPVVPLVAPFSAADGSAAGYTWYFGMLRCDI